MLKSIFLKNKSQGFTLVELLVVISVMALIGIVVFVNFSGYQKDQALQKHILDIQTLIRTAQTNATARVVCSTTNATKAGSEWYIEFVNNSRVDLGCINNIPGFGTQVAVVKTVNLSDGVIVRSSNCFTGVNGIPTVVKFAPLYGNISFTASPPGIGAVTNCGTSPVNVIITLENQRNSGATSTVRIDAGGAVYVQ